MITTSAESGSAEAGGSGKLTPSHQRGSSRYSGVVGAAPLARCADAARVLIIYCTVASFDAHALAYTAVVPTGLTRPPASGARRPATAPARAQDGGGFRIGEVARALGVSPSTVRAWERKGLIRPERGTGRHRRYAAADIDRLRDVQSLLGRGYSAPA